MSVGRNAPSRQPEMTCLLRSGACQYTSTRSSSAFTSRGGSVSPLTDLRQEEHEPVRPGAIARERRVGLRREPPLGRAPYQRERVGRVPGLADERAPARHDEQEHASPHEPLVGHCAPLTLAGSSMTGISRWLLEAGKLARARADGVRRRARATHAKAVEPSATRVIPLAAAIVLETAGPAAGGHGRRASSPASPGSSCSGTDRRRTSSSPRWRSRRARSAPTAAVR